MRQRLGRHKKTLLAAIHLLADYTFLFEMSSCWFIHVAVAGVAYCKNSNNWNSHTTPETSLLTLGGQEAAPLNLSLEVKKNKNACDLGNLASSSTLGHGPISKVLTVFVPHILQLNHPDTLCVDGRLEENRGLEM